MPFGNTRTIEADRWKTGTTTGTERMREHREPDRGDCPLVQPGGRNLPARVLLTGQRTKNERRRYAQPKENGVYPFRPTLVWLNDTFWHCWASGEN
jgi:hypothetical protein